MLVDVHQYRRGWLHSRNGLTDKRASTVGAYRQSTARPAHRGTLHIVAVCVNRIGKLVTNIASTKINSRQYELEVQHVECVVLVGILPINLDEIGSFELVRNQFKDVRVITFDELLERLQTLRELLAGERYMSVIEDGDEEDFSESVEFEEDDEDFEDVDLHGG